MLWSASSSYATQSAAERTSQRSLRKKKKDFAVPFVTSVIPKDVNAAEELPQEDVLKEIEEPFYVLPPDLRPALQPNPPSSDRELPYTPLYTILERWNPDNPEIPESFREVLQHFNYGDPVEREMAAKYREAEMPFKLYNVSGFQETSNKWTDVYLNEKLEGSSRRSHVERSKNNHFMFWSGKPQSLREFTPPTQIISDMRFTEWLHIAKEADQNKLSNITEHFYFMSGADAHEHGRTFISRDLPMFSTEENNFFITNVGANKGIQCRFGMRGIIAEAHYDSGKNMVAMIKGAKRYIITPPWTCDHLSILSDTKHPSYRHSVVDWSDLDQARQNKFHEVDAIDTIVHKGEVLYIPSYWFHYIVSLKYSIQCNSRSGAPPGRKGYEHIISCFAKSGHAPRH